MKIALISLMLLSCSNVFSQTAEEWHNKGDKKSDQQDYSKAIEADSNDADTYNSRGIAKANIEDYKGAIADFNKAIEINLRPCSHPASKILLSVSY